MKILHTSDWHLGKGEGNRNYLDDQEFFIGEIKNIVKERQIDAVIIAGDIYDRSNPKSEAIKLYDEAVTSLCMDLGVKVFVVAGNHDNANLLSSCNELLKKSGLYVSGTLDKDCNKPISIDDVDFYLIPWISTERVKYVFPGNNDIRSLNDAYRVTCEYIGKTLNPNRKNICISHSFVTNNVSSKAEEQVTVGRAGQVSADHYKIFDYTALGHLHAPHNICENIRYSGTPMAYTFGEEDHQKSVTIIDTDLMSTEIVPLKQKRTRKSISDTYEKIKNYDLTEEEKVGYLKIDVTDKILTYEMVSNISSIYENVLEISGKSIGKEMDSITMTVDDLKTTSDIDIFKRFYEDQKGVKPTDDIVEIFTKALNEVEAEYETN